MSSILDHEPPSVPENSGCLAPYRDSFLMELGKLDYAARTIGYYQRAIDGFFAEVESCGVGAELAATHERKE